MNRTFIILLGIGITLTSLHSSVLAQENVPAVRGVLDEPLTPPDQVPQVALDSAPSLLPTVAQPFDTPNRDPDLNSADPNVRQEAVQMAVEEDIEELEALPMSQVEARAESGERAAQVVLGTDFAREAQSLSNMPALANSAAEDAVRWYSQAARRGFPGAPSLDYAGVSFYPIRVQRTRN